MEDRNKNLLTVVEHTDPGLWCAVSDQWRPEVFSLWSPGVWWRKSEIVVWVYCIRDSAHAVLPRFEVDKYFGKITAKTNLKNFGISGTKKKKL